MSLSGIMCRCFEQLYRILIVYENWPRRRREFSVFFGKFNNLKSKIKDICLEIFPFFSRGLRPRTPSVVELSDFFLTKKSKCRVNSFFKTFENKSNVELSHCRVKSFFKTFENKPNVELSHCRVKSLWKKILEMAELSHGRIKSFFLTKIQVPGRWKGY